MRVMIGQVTEDVAPDCRCGRKIEPVPGDFELIDASADPPRVVCSGCAVVEAPHIVGALEIVRTASCYIGAMVRATDGRVGHRWNDCPNCGISVLSIGADGPVVRETGDDVPGGTVCYMRCRECDHQWATLRPEGGGR